MAYQLRLEEILQAMWNSDHPDARSLTGEFEALTSKAARMLGDHLDVEVGEATFDLGFIAAPFMPKHSDQELPSQLRDFDTDEEWLVEGVGLSLT